MTTEDSTSKEAPKITKPKDPKKVERGKQLAKVARSRREEKIKEEEEKRLREEKEEEEEEKKGEESEPLLSKKTLIAGGTALLLSVLYLYGSGDKTEAPRIREPVPQRQEPKEPNYDLE